MKIKKFAAAVAFTLLSFAFLQGCGLFHGGNNCDCPKFGQADNFGMEYLAGMAAEASMGQ